MAYSGTWRVAPIRLDFDQRSRSGVVTITNTSDETIHFSVEGLQWTQDAEGKDVYEETSDLLFFPKLLTLEPRQERIIRAGIKVPALKEEKTYRLFIKQESAPEKQAGTNVAIAIRFGVPIFSKPLQEDVSGKINRAIVENGTVKIGLNNTGNTHLRISEIQVSGRNAAGETSYQESLSGSYLLANAQKTFTSQLPEDICRQLEALNIQVISNHPQLNETIDVDEAMCLAP